MSDKAERVARWIQGIYHQGVYQGETNQIAAILREEYPEEPKAKTCHSECGLRARYPISCKRRDCQHITSEPTKGDGSEEHPFIDQFVGKAFARKDYNGREFSFGVCERDDGYEITVVPVGDAPVRHYRLNPDGTIDNLACSAEPAQAEPKEDA